METTLHKQLKQIYAGDEGVTEVRQGAYRFDAYVNGAAIEIQLGNLSAIRAKLAVVTEDVPVRLIKPIIQEKFLRTVDAKTGQVQSRRRSPKRGALWSTMIDLVYLRSVFPHPRLTIEFPPVSVEEIRCPDARFRRRRKGYRVLDVRLLDWSDGVAVRTVADLKQLLPATLAKTFDSAELATALDQPRWCAQKIAYVLRHAGAVTAVGKRRGSWLYSRMDEMDESLPSPSAMPQPSPPRQAAA